MVLCLVVLCQAMVIMLEESVGHYMPFCFNFEAGFFFIEVTCFGFSFHLLFLLGLHSSKYK